MRRPPGARLFRALLFLYPARFRRAYGAEMADLFDRRMSRVSGPAASLRAAARAYADLMAGAAAERFAAPPVPREKDPMLSLIARDLHIAARTLLRQPAFSATVVLTLAVAIGATTTMAALVDATILRPLPYPAADRLVAIVDESPRTGPAPFAIPFVREFRTELTQYDAVGAFTSTWEMTVTGAGEARTVPTAFVTDGLLELFGARPRSGRLFTAADEAAGAQLAVVSERFWARTFGAAPLDGQIIRIDDQPVTIVGVLAGELRMPITASAFVASRESAEIWLPLSTNPLAGLRAIPIANIVGRLSPGSHIEAARAEAAGLPQRWSAIHREVAPDARYVAVPLTHLVSEPVRRPLLALLGAVVLLLLIACANVANLMLVRSTARASELAVRAALGATRSRLVAQMLADSLVLTAVGAALGVLIAWLAIAALPSLALGDLPPSATISMDLRVVTIAALTGLFVALVVSVIPAVQASRGAIYAKIRDGARTIGSAGRVRSTLALAEIALALVLLISAGLLARSFWTLSQVDPGFRASNLLATGVAMPGSRYPTADSRRAFVIRALETLEALPGVTRAAAVNRVPLGGANVTVGVEIEGKPQPDGPVSMDRRVITPGYFETLGIRLVAGRPFGVDDRADAADRVVAISEAVARRFWPDGNPIGGRLRLMLRGGPGPWLRVTGVFGSVRHHGLDQPAEPEVYVPYEQAAVESMVFLTKTAGDPLPLVEPVRQAMQRLDPLMPVRQEMPSDLVDASVAEPRLRALLFNGFALAALLLSAIGIYGVVSHGVAERTREIGVRVALGATRGRILALVMQGGLRTVLLGIGGGLVAAVLAARAMRGLLFGVPPFDPVTFAAVTLLLLFVAILAMLVPARRAMRLDPVRALKID